MDDARKTELYDESDPWMSANQASKQLDIVPATVRTLVLQKKLVSQVVGGRLFVHRDSVRQYLEARSAAPAVAAR